MNVVTPNLDALPSWTRNNSRNKKLTSSQSSYTTQSFRTYNRKFKIHISAVKTKFLSDKHYMSHHKDQPVNTLW